MTATICHASFEQVHNFTGWQMRVKLPRDTKQIIMDTFTGSRRRGQQFNQKWRKLACHFSKRPVSPALPLRSPAKVFKSQIPTRNAGKTIPLRQMLPRRKANRDERSETLLLSNLAPVPRKLRRVHF
jgi:hypothetical protein